jgi:predicted hydrocarbon binding protein
MSLCLADDGAGARSLPIRPETLAALQKAIEAALPGAGEARVRARRSPFAEAYGPSAAPVCHLTRGVLESLAAATLGGTPRVVETECLAMGAARCRFETIPGGQAGYDRDRRREGTTT